jgi:hypothetical protein
MTRDRDLCVCGHVDRLHLGPHDDGKCTVARCACKLFVLAVGGRALKGDGVTDDAPALQRLLRPWEAGERCRAVMPIFYAHNGVEIDEGGCGVVVATRPDVSAILMIRWEGREDLLATSADAVEPDPS